MKPNKILILLLFIMAPQLLLAQPPSPPFERGPMREKVRERIRTMKIWKLTEAVGLTSQQSERFFPVYNKYQKNLDDIESRRAELIDRLEEATSQPGSSDKEIEEIANALSDIPRQMMSERERFYKEIADVLPIRQQAQLTVFEERFRQRLQEFIRDIRREFRGGKFDDQ